MKVLLTTAALVLSTVPMLAQSGEQGVSHPDQAPIAVESNDGMVQQQAVPPVASTPKPAAGVPYSAPAPPANTVVNPDAGIVTTNAPAASQNDDSVYRPYRPYTGGPAGLTARTQTHDIDADIVTDVPLKAGEMPEGTLLKVRMNDPVSTKNTIRGSAFTATITDDVQREGRVVIPAGSVLDGEVTEVRGGRRISGKAAIHLEPRRITLPDGTYYVLHAQVVDTGEDNKVSVNQEGTILRRDHPKETLAEVTLATGSGAVAGAMLGGGVGAIVGASIGAGASTVIWLKQDRQTALPKDTALTFCLTTPMMIQPMRDGAQLRP
jgi:hypothetical protein